MVCVGLSGEHSGSQHTCRNVFPLSLSFRQLPTASLQGPAASELGRAASSQAPCPALPPRELLRGDAAFTQWDGVLVLFFIFFQCVDLNIFFFCDGDANLYSENEIPGCFQMASVEFQF